MSSHRPGVRKLRNVKHPKGKFRLDQIRHAALVDRRWKIAIVLVKSL
jgi:hypothetical protein